MKHTAVNPIDEDTYGATHVLNMNRRRNTVDLRAIASHLGAARKPAVSSALAIEKA
jgi:hypothetical protein